MGAIKSVTIRSQIPHQLPFLDLEKVQEGFILEMLKYHHMMQSHKKGAREI